MIDLIIENINDKIGPGDIVGAFINEAKVDSEDIGKIIIYRRRAEVEVSPKVARRVIDVMDNNQIGGITVDVKPKNPEQLLDKELIQYINKYKKLVQLERQAEMDRHEREIKRLSPEEREEKGRAILHLRGRDEGTAFGNKKVVKFVRQKRGEPLPDTEISVGDLVMISIKNPLDQDNPTGTVAEKTRYSLTVVFDRNPVPFVYGKGLRVDLYVNDITFQRMLDTLESLKKVRGRKRQLRDIILGKRLPGWLQKDNKIKWVNNKLNSSQKRAVIDALRARDFFLIQGPPGTGKTMTAIEIINQAIDNKDTVLATADSNIAVDNLVERLARSGVEVIRVGHPLRVTPVLREHTLDYKVLEHPDYQKAQSLRAEASKLLKEQDRLTHPSGRWRRGLSNQQIRKLASNKKYSRGVPAKKIQEMAEWLKIQDEIENYFDKIEKLEEKAVDDLIKTADVVCATNSTSGSELMANRYFDLIVIDEATQSTEPAALIPLLKGKKIILIGDHKQLPPTIISKKAEEEGLSLSLFERLYRLHGREFWTILTVQYRMHDKIMNFPNKYFYEESIESDSSVANHTLLDLGLELEGRETFIEKALAPQSPLVFLDTANMGARERSLPGSNSYDNIIEAEIVLDILDEAIRLGVKPSQIAVITPYKDQVDLLNQRNRFDNLEINTVDGFQGREKEVVILSLVRSNSYKNIGFLRDLRRINVALTRAKRKLIIVGDSNTISVHDLYNQLLTYIKEKGLYYLL